MLELLKEDLQQQGVFTASLPTILQKIVESIPNQNINYRMKLTIAASELILFTSHLRRNISHWNGSMIPINAISFSIAASGDGKDSAVNAARKCFAGGYSVVEAKRKEIAKHNAIRAAQAAGKPDPGEWDTYKDYYTAPNPLFVAPSTSEGFIQHLNDLDAAGTGAGFIYSGEFGAELANGGMIVDNIKLLAEMYDEGSKEVKVLKSRENQSKEIKNLPVSALFVGSQDNILYDESTKRVFKREFSTKLARRSFFNFNPETVPPINYSSVDQMLTAEKRVEDQAIEARKEVYKIVTKLAESSVAGAGQPLSIDEDVRNLFVKYKRYNEELAPTIKAQYSISKLVRKHMQWKALKTAGAIAIINGHNSITKEDYMSAITYCEMLDQDMQLFERELVKEPYEVFVDYMHSIADNHKSSVSLHQLRKLGYIPTSGVPQNKMKELVHLAASYDTDGVYTVCEAGICYEEIIKTTVAGVSYKPVDNSGVARAVANKEGKESIKKEKIKVAKQAVDGYDFMETDFPDLGDMLKGDFAYSPFQYIDGVRTADSLIGGCKWICLDIDDSTITDEECHFILQDINHHIARTSDPDNEFKFRVLIELDSIVDIPNAQWSKFLGSIGETLSLNVDKLAKSQLYFSFSGRNVLSVTDKEPLEAKNHVMLAMTEDALAQEKKPTSAQAKAMLDDELETFSFAFNAGHGERSRSLIRAAKYAKDLGMSSPDICELMHRISDYWDEPFDEKRMQNTIISQIMRWK